MAGAQHRQRQRRAPGAAAEHGHTPAALGLAGAGHALAPRRPEPTIGAEMLSSGQRERGTKSAVFSSAMPARRRSMPAQAIIAALSVQSFSGGAMKAKPACWQRPSSVALIVRL